MSKKLGPISLFFIGLLCIIASNGDIGGDVVKNVLGFGGVILWIAAVIGAIKTLSGRDNGEAMAKRLLATYQEYKTRNPEADKMELYTQVARTVPQYRSRKDLEELFEFAHSLAVKRDGVMDAHVTLMWLVLAMCIIEASDRSGDNRMSGSKATRLYGVVYRLIPRDL